MPYPHEPPDRRAHEAAPPPARDRDPIIRGPIIELQRVSEQGAFNADFSLERLLDRLRESAHGRR